MKRSFKRSWSAGAALVVAASIAPLLSAPTAFAAGSLQGAATVKNAAGAANLGSGNSDTTFTLRLPTGASCSGDSATDGYRWQTYMVPSTVDPSTLTFNASGPIGAGNHPLFTITGSPVVNQQTAAASPSPGPGPIVNIPDMNYAVYGPGVIPPGNYNIGVACTLGGAGATQMSNYWNATETITTDATTGGTSQFSWVTPAVCTQTAPPAPVLATVSGGSTTLSANFTAGSPAANTCPPVTTGYTATATPTTPPGAPVTQGGTASPISFTGLTNGTVYSVTVHATNTVGSSAESNAVSGSPTANFGTLVQEITVTRPAGALVFTQLCGKHAAISADATFGTPAFTASTTGTAPFLGPNGSGGQADTSSYPYVGSPFPVTYCGLAMGPATITPGGQFLTSTGVLNQVTVADTRDTDIGWNVSGTMANMTSSSTTSSISGNQLGLKSQVGTTATYDDGAGNTYTQTAAGNTINPGATTGLGTSRTIASAAAAAGPATARTGGIGVATVDAALKLLIPANVKAGDYKGNLTLTLS